MNFIKNVHKLEELGFTKEVLTKLEYGAQLHNRHARITFKVLTAVPGELTIEVRQDKSPAENYATSKRLIEIGHEWLEPAGNSIRVHVRPVPYVQPPTDVVESEWIKKQMQSLQISSKQICDDTGIDKTSMSAYVNGLKPLSQTVKSMFFYYFKSKGE